MKTVAKSVLLWHAPQEMYALVTGVEQYPRFLPWCDHARILTSDDQGVTAEVGIAFGGVRQTFVTRNAHDPGRSVVISLVDGPFSRLDGSWSFSTLGDGSQRACRVELHLNYGFDNAVLGRLVGPVFDRIAANLVDAFVKRADQVYGL
ncbi:MAG: type II toxin-antitoxin system RatA family toxin [Rhodoferax sp.]|nr:type II toxin-antitoxin system RatA family toxin [Rhodoferax sp.]